MTNNIGMKVVDSGAYNGLKLTSKRLRSGKVQVKFMVSGLSKREEYGYLLTEPKTSLKEVVARIFGSFDNGLAVGYQKHLYSVGKTKQETSMLIIR